MDGLRKDSHVLYLSLLNPTFSIVTGTAQEHPAAILISHDPLTHSVPECSPGDGDGPHDKRRDGKKEGREI